LGMKSVAAVLPERHPSKMIAAPVEDAPIADSYAITHLTALLRYSRASRPADLAAALAPTRSVDPVDVERLVAWASMLVTELKQRL